MIAMDQPSVLYHATAYPENIEVEGLRPFPNQTCVYHDYAQYPDPDIAAQACRHKGAFIFATPSAELAKLYAFKTAAPSNDPMYGDFPGRMFRCGQTFTPCGVPIALAVVGHVEAYREALEGLTPTRFGIQRTEDFEPVFTPGDDLTGEWIARAPVAARHLVAERVRFEDLAGVAEFLEVAAPYRADSLSHLRGQETLALLQKGILRPANHRLGLPSLLNPMTRPYEGKAVIMQYEA